MAYVATIGFFDGVHPGHQFLLQKLREEASRRELQAAVVTFEEHPQSVLHGVSPGLLTDFDERVSLLKAECLDQIFAFRFEVIRDMSSLEFLHVLHDQCDVKVLLMGYDHQFGADGRKSPEEYARLGEEVGVEILPMPLAPEGKVSSSRIRQALLAGRVEEAACLLGRRYVLRGEVVHGQGLGRQLGFPTANVQLSCPDKIVPMNGVYAVEVALSEGDELRPAVLNVGTNPTVGGVERTLEVHIPGFSGDLYGSVLSVSFVHRLRDEQHFDSLDALRQQIAIDVSRLP